ncbi:RNA exonuclease 3 [Thoreauomyces humboldtii]|nr:RNA exonuclease 3 [Thoreauomyces humboldtii]
MSLLARDTEAGRPATTAARSIAALPAPVPAPEPVPVAPNPPTKRSARPALSAPPAKRRELLPGPPVTQVKLPDASPSFSARVTAAIASAPAPALSKQPDPRTRLPTKFQASAFAHMKSGRPPTLKAILTCPVPLKTRQHVVEMFYEEFLRIYTPAMAHKPTAPHQHAVRQEQDLLHKSTKATYSQVASGIMKRLRARPVAENEKDTGIDGVWKPKPGARSPHEIPMELLLPLVASPDELRNLGYPTRPNPEDPEAAISLPSELPVQGENQKCDRCSKNFEPKWPLEEGDDTICKHHWGYLRTVNQEGSKFRLWSCCHATIESEGCSLGPHVFKEEQTELLEKRIPFKTLPKSSPTSKKIVGIDCEMSYTTGGMELTRVSVIDYDGARLIDELVRTTFPVLDYNTRWSGIDNLDKARYDLDGVRELLDTMLSKETIIVGHGLENDLRAMRIFHEQIIDTAALYPHPRGLPERHPLRLLTQKVLGRFIQQGQNGHDSIEDAKACLDLVKHKISKGQFC